MKPGDEWLRRNTPPDGLKGLERWVDLKSRSFHGEPWFAEVRALVAERYAREAYEAAISAVNAKAQEINRTDEARVEALARRLRESRPQSAPDSQSQLRVDTAGSTSENQEARSERTSKAAMTRRRGAWPILATIAGVLVFVFGLSGYRSGVTGTDPFINPSSPGYFPPESRIALVVGAGLVEVGLFSVRRQDDWGSVGVFRRGATKTTCPHCDGEVTVEDSTCRHCHEPI